MVNIVGVRFKTSSRIYYFAPGEFEPILGDTVLVETSMGEEQGQVVLAPQEVSMNNIIQPIKSLLGIIKADSEEVSCEKKENARDALNRANILIEKHKLDMKLVDVEYSHCGGKVTFYFTSDGRVDFRNLVRELAGVFRMRIELRQIGVRDEARMVGGLGCCGREVCCKLFLREFQPVSIKMAKEQSLSLNPSKISGVCGRLMCCLQYEQSTYQQLKKDLPKIGKVLYTPEGEGVVIGVQVIAEKVKVRITREDNSYEIHEFKVADVSTEAPVPLRKKGKAASDAHFDLGLKEMGLGELVFDENGALDKTIAKKIANPRATDNNKSNFRKPRRRRPAASNATSNANARTAIKPAIKKAVAKLDNKEKTIPKNIIDKAEVNKKPYIRKNPPRKRTNKPNKPE